MNNIGMLVGLLGVGVSGWLYFENQKLKKQSEVASKVVAGVSLQGIDFKIFNLSPEELTTLRNMVQNSSSKVIPTASITPTEA
jgi:hypothetical protein